jgi:hypothetical protein
MSAREIIAIPIALASILFLVLAFSFPFLLLEQSEKNAHRLSELRSVQTYLDQTLSARKSLPKDDHLRRWAERRQLDLASSVSTAPLGCLNNFAKAPRDQYLVGFWAGEWSECLSSPSGATTLKSTVLALLQSGLWVDVVLYVALAIGLGWAAWMLGLRRRLNGS